MKKYIVAAFFAALFSVPAMAQNVVGLEYKFEDPRNGNKKQAQGYEVTLGTTVAPNLGVDFRGQTMFTNDNGANSTNLEFGVIPTMAFSNSLTGYVRAAVGNRWIPGENYAFYSVEPGVKFAVVPNLGLKVAYRFRDAFEQNNVRQYQTNTARFGLDYAVTKNSAVYGGFDYQWGDINSNIYSVGYKLTF